MDPIGRELSATGRHSPISYQFGIFLRRGEIPLKLGREPVDGGTGSGYIDRELVMCQG
jgi:hypothetical protein